MSEVVKTCSKHGDLTSENARQRKGRKGKTYLYCIECVRQGHKRSYEKHKEKFIARNLEYSKKNKDRIKLIRIKTRAKNKEINSQRVREKFKEHVNNLSDHYIKMILSRYSVLSFKEIPRKLVELKKVTLSIKRKIKEIENDS